MRTIDADALGRNLNDIWLSKTPSGTDNIETQTYKGAVCEGLRLAMDAVMEAPTVKMDALELLQQSRPSNMNDKDKPLRITRCGGCGIVIVYRGQDVCPYCGMAVKWE